MTVEKLTGNVFCRIARRSYVVTAYIVRFSFSASIGFRELFSANKTSSELFPLSPMPIGSCGRRHRGVRNGARFSHRGGASQFEFKFHWQRNRDFRSRAPRGNAIFVCVFNRRSLYVYTYRFKTRLFFYYLTVRVLAPVTGLAHAPTGPGSGIPPTGGGLVLSAEYLCNSIVIHTFIYIYFYLRKFKNSQIRRIHVCFWFGDQTEITGWLFSERRERAKKRP